MSGQDDVKNLKAKNPMTSTVGEQSHKNDGRNTLKFVYFSFLLSSSWKGRKKNTKKYKRISTWGEYESRMIFYVNEKSSTPSVITEKPGGERRQDEGTDSRSADGNARGQRPPLFKVETDGDDSRNVDETHANATQYADKDVKELDGHGQRRHGQAEAGHHAADACHRPKTESRGQRRHERP